MTHIPVYSIKIPEYNVKEKPDWEKLGAIIDKTIRKYFMGKKIAVRCLGSSEHEGKSITDLIRIIKQIGHDRYDSKRKGNKYGNIENKKIDIFCLDYKVTPKIKIMGNMIKSFFVYPLEEGDDPTRIDIVIIYDRAKLKKVLHKYEGRADTKIDGFVFKDQNRKQEAILGLIKIL